jgi:8-oxo-dGTP pyrophosphatase MutT (NUDIX family)
MAFLYTVAPHLAYFDVPSAEFTASRPEFDSFGVGGFIFFQDANATESESQSAPPPRTLLLQRALTDSMPGCWEGPGGSHEPEEDRTLLDGVVREVLEETGLHVSRIVELVSVDGWTHKRREDGRFIRIAKYSFIVEVHEAVCEVSGETQIINQDSIPVVLEVDAHDAFEWATEEDVQTSLQSGTGAFKFTPFAGPNLARAFDLLKKVPK